jgi:hypothetical protein
LQVSRDVDADTGVTVSVHRTDALTGTRCSRYTRLRAEYISTREGSVRMAR